MTIEVVKTNKPEEWDSYVTQASHATPFHQYAALDLFANHTNTDLHLLIGYKGQEPVELLPLFETNRGPFTKIHSPPDAAELAHLGPVQLHSNGVKQRKVEKDHRRFVNACWEWIETSIEPDFVSLWSSDRYTDVRPYLWNDFEASPRYIYIIELGSGVEALFNDLTKETRRRIRNTDEQAYEIIEGDLDATQLLVRQLQDRHKEQGMTYGLTPELMAEFHARLPDEQLHPYCLCIDEEMVSGLLALEFGDTMHVWIGGVKTDVDLPVNELLYWHIIEQAAAKDLDRVDLTTAMIPSLADYKAKFGPEPRVMFELRWESQVWQATKFGYRRLPKRGHELIQSLLS
ncbi:GNAT family N-acetyltransferase [Natronosalvus caseinilyticus]|uniref:GNAT family N-acetyltransferase n=1 Tax=Natronosalvus caseinilyticus TaxID=2953747 RepID=UPI0028A81BCD|nr:GNAT family N-acetyltransferase [Natronosalvus caseinilyticus]